MDRPRRPLLASVPLLPVALCLMAGITTGSFCARYWIYGAAIMAALCFIGLWKKQSMLVLMAVSVVAGMLTTDVHTPPEVDVTGREAVFTGVARSVKRYDFSQWVTLELTCGSGGRIWLRLHAALPAIEVGDTLQFVSVLETVDREPRFPGEFIPGRQARREGVTAVAELIPDGCAESHASLNVIKPDHPGISVWMSRQRERFIDAIYESGISAPSAAFLTAVLTGESSYLDYDLKATFATAGIAHILALSGMHVSVIAFMVSLLFFPLGLAGKRRMAMALTIFVLWSYAFMTGLSPSVFRAVVMATVVFGGIMLRRDSSPLNSLCLAAIVILLFSPDELFSPGFQLSFAAVAAIIMFAFELTPGWKMPVILLLIWQRMAVCISAVAGTAAISAWHFHQVPVYFIPANIPAALLLPCLMGGEIFLIFMNAIGIQPEWLVGFVDTGYAWLAETTGFISSLSGASLHAIVFPWWLLVTYYAGLVAAWLSLKLRNDFWGIMAGILFLFTFAAYMLMPPFYPRAEAYVVEYPYATVIVAREGNRCVLLSDAPPSQYGRVEKEMGRTLRDFANMRGAVLEPVNTVIKGQEIFAVGNVWCFRDKVVVLVGLRRELEPVPVRPSYALVSGRYYGSMEDVKEIIDPDTIVLAPSLNEKQMRRYMAELDTMGMPFRIGLPGTLL